MPSRITLSGSMPLDLAALEHDVALLRVHHAADGLEHRGLAGAVGAQDGDDAALAARRS